METLEKEASRPQTERIWCEQIPGQSSIAIVRIDRVERSNSYTSSMLKLLEDQLSALAENPEIRAVIIRGQGNQAFSAGADKDELRTRRAEDALRLQSRKVFNRLASMPMITIAAVNGAAMGGGFELALACDIRVAAPHAKFALPELKLGLSPAAGGMDRLPEIIGKARTKEIILFGLEVNSETALSWGLVSYSGADFDAKALELAERVSKLDPLAVQLAKRVIDASQGSEKNELNYFAQALLYERRFTRSL